MKFYKLIRKLGEIKCWAKTHNASQTVTKLSFQQVLYLNSAMSFQCSLLPFIESALLYVKFGDLFERKVLPF